MKKSNSIYSGIFIIFLSITLFSGCSSSMQFVQEPNTSDKDKKAIIYFHGEYSAFILDTYLFDDNSDIAPNSILVINSNNNCVILGFLKLQNQSKITAFGAKSYRGGVWEGHLDEMTNVTEKTYAKYNELLGDSKSKDIGNNQFVKRTTIIGQLASNGSNIKWARPAGKFIIGVFHSAPQNEEVNVLKMSDWMSVEVGKLYQINFESVQFEYDFKFKEIDKEPVIKKASSIE